MEKKYSLTQRLVTRAMRHAIESTGRTQRWVAERAGLSQKHLNEILQGKSWPRPEVIDRVLAACEQEIVVSAKRPTDTLEARLDHRKSDAILIRVGQDQLDALAAGEPVSVLILPPEEGTPPVPTGVIITGPGGTDD